MLVMLKTIDKVNFHKDRLSDFKTSGWEYIIIKKIKNFLNEILNIYNKRFFLIYY